MLKKETKRYSNLVALIFDETNLGQTLPSDMNTVNPEPQTINTLLLWMKRASQPGYIKSLLRCQDEKKVIY